MSARPARLAMFLLVFASACGVADVVRGRDRTDDHDMSALMRAAAAGDSAEVVRLLDDGAEINQTVRPHSSLRSFIAFISWMQDLPDRDDGYAALHYALQGRELGIARVLLQRGAAPPADDRMVWMLAHMAGESGLRLLIDHGVTPDPGAGIVVLLSASMSDTSSLRLMLDAGAPVDAVQQGATPLMSAARNGDEAVVRMLLAAGADPARPDTTSGWTAAMIARDAGHDHIADLIGGPEDADALQNAELGRAVVARDAAAVERLLGAGADANTRVGMYDTALSLALNNPDHTIVDLLLRAGANPNTKTIADVTVLMEAVQSGDSALVARLLQAGGNARAPGLASAAAAAGSLPLVRLLASAGANVREHSDQPLRSAVGRNGSIEVVRFLLERGASPRAVDSNGRNALGGAVAFRKPEIVSLLLDSGADPNQALGSWTPLMDAAMQGDSAMVELLLQRGADPNLRDENGRTPAEIARRAGHPDVAARLSRAGARPGF